MLDDEPALTSSLRRLLERANYHVTASNHPREAVAMIESNPADFDLVITDLSMPEMSGIEVARRIRAVRPELPVIAMSGFATEAIRENLAAAGIAELLEKPVAPANLAKCLKHTFGQA